MKTNDIICIVIMLLVIVSLGQGVGFKGESKAFCIPVNSVEKFPSTPGFGFIFKPL